jgi:hypothetical protein
MARRDMNLNPEQADAKIREAFGRGIRELTRKEAGDLVISIGQNKAIAPET